MLRHRPGLTAATAIAPTIAVAFLLAPATILPAAASAQGVVPPGNSAVNQYTEAYPTTGGSKTTGDRGGGSPSKVLGTKNAHKLEAKGAEGEAAAVVAAETAPSAGSPAAEGGGTAEGGGKKAKRARGKAAGAGAKPAVKPGGGEPGGSSGLGEVLGQATGTSSSGELGLLLPFVILAVAVGSLIYLWRRRRAAA